MEQLESYLKIQTKPKSHTMKAIMIIVILLSIITVNVSAQKLGIYTIASKDTSNQIKASPIADFYITKSLSKKFSISTYLYFSQDWSKQCCI